MWCTEGITDGNDHNGVSPAVTGRRPTSPPGSLSLGDGCQYKVRRVPDVRAAGPDRRLVKGVLIGGFCRLGVVSANRDGLYIKRCRRCVVKLWLLHDDWTVAAG